MVIRFNGFKVHHNKRNKMKKASYILLTATILSACQSEDNLPVQHHDDYDVISFSARTEIPVTRTTDDYESYNISNHPGTMGVFGYHSITPTVEVPETGSNTIFNNISCSYDAEGKKWGYTNEADKKYWPDYNWYKSFDFAAYMPYQADATFTKQAGDTEKYTLSFSSSISSPIITDTREAAIISNVPVHESDDKIGEKIQFTFDQTLTGYHLKFQIDEKMGAIRFFRIKSVKLYGDNFAATSGKVSRTYEWDNAASSWKNSNITWSGLNKVSVAKADAIEITNPDGPLKVTSEAYSPWGSNFYAIPNEAFNPTFEVTYDVEMTDEKGNDIITRQGVTSTIMLSKLNFSSLTAGQPGKINSIRILIKPRYLYVLADQDKASGLLLVD